MKIIGKISSLFSVFILYVLFATFYMDLKGFTYNNGEISFVKNANAKTDTSIASPLNKRVLINLSNMHYMGKKEAPITIYEYSSFSCTHCADFHLDTLKKLDEKYIKSGKVKVVLVYMPTEKKAMAAAMTASCIPDENYHDFVDLMYKKQREWALSNRTKEIIAQYASLHGISKDIAFECMQNDAIASEISGNVQQALNELNIQGTPTLIVDDGTTQDFIAGSPAFDAFTEYLDEKLSKLSK